MLNLARPQPVRIKQQRRIIRLESGFSCCVFALGCLLTWNAWQQRQPVPPPPLPKAVPLMAQPLSQHFKLWQLLHQNRPAALQIKQLEYTNQQWMVQVLTQDLGELYRWQEQLLQKQQLSIELQQSQTSNLGYRIRLRVTLL